MAHLATTQLNPADTERAKNMKPYEYYNQFVRKEGEKVLDEAEYNALLQKKLKERDKVSLAQAELMFEDLKKHPLIPDDATPGK